MKKVFYGIALGALFSLFLVITSSALTTPGNPPLPPDNTPPGISVITPANNATVSSTLIISGVAADNFVVASVQLSVDGGVYVPATGTATWTYRWDTTAVQNGPHTIQAEAIDPSGNVGLASIVAVTVNNSTSTPPPPPPSAPTVSITSPANNASISSRVNVAGIASSTIGIGSVGIAVDGGNYTNASGTTTWIYSLNTKPLANATHTITAVATDLAGTTATATIAVNVNNPVIPPGTPSSLSVQLDMSSLIAFSWVPSAAGSYPIAGYNVYRGGLFIGTTPNTGYLNNGLSPNTTYVYTLSTYDTKGNTSAQSAPLTVKTPGVQGSAETSPGSTFAALLPSLITQMQGAVSAENILLVASLTQNLSVGSTGQQVANLQIFLNDNGYPVATSGPGSSGNESQYFGAATAAALAKFQNANGLPATGFFGPLTRSYLALHYPSD